MRKISILTAFIFCFSCITHVLAQTPLKQINIVSFNVKNKLPADVSTWGTIPAGLMLVAQKVPQVNLQGIKLVIQIKQGGSRICGTAVEAAQLIDIGSVRNFTGNELVGFLAQCPTLKSGNYIICVQFFNIDRYPISEERCRDFVVEDQVQIQQSYSPPQNISPVNEKKFTINEQSAPITFRWTPIVPKPKGAVTYRLRVWQLMQGQTGSAAMKSNGTIFEKDVNSITQAIVTNLYTGPCKPPYLCDYVWNVQALDKESKPLGTNNGTSELSSWSFGTTQSGTLKLLSPENKSVITPVENAPINFRWTPLVPKPQQPVTYRLRVWQLMQGQNSTQAMRTNKPIVTKDVADITEVSISNIYTGPCKPPYLCDFVWTVQALDKDGIVLSGEEAVNSWSFGIQNAGSTKSPSLVSPMDNKIIPLEEAKKSITFRWSPVIGKPGEHITYRYINSNLAGNNTYNGQAYKAAVTKEVVDVTEITISEIYTGPCKPPYLCDYTWQVQAFGSDGKPIGDNEGKSELFHYSLQETGDTKLPILIAPSNNSSLTKDEAGLGLKFRWTPLVPKPQQPITYRLRVWQLMQGQNSTQAMRTNKPIVTKDVADITEVSISNIYTGPCKPPYLCDFVWTVQALDKEGKVLTSNEGAGTIFQFNIK
jgi:hypothetical protein